jgi:hypothetical protein
MFGKVCKDFLESRNYKKGLLQEKPLDSQPKEGRSVIECQPKVMAASRRHPQWNQA